MSVIEITKDQLRTMKDQEGLIIQGCGGDINEWVNGINETLTESGILLNGTKFNAAYKFQDGNITDLCFSFKKDVELDVGKLAMWRLATHEQFGGTWLSDYVNNRLGGFVEEQQKTKPDCELIGQDGNIFNLMGIASNTLREHGMVDEAKEMCEKVTQSNSYHEALGVIGEYVNITGPDELDDFEEDYDFEQTM